MSNEKARKNDCPSGFFSVPNRQRTIPLPTPPTLAIVPTPIVSGPEKYVYNYNSVNSANAIATQSPYAHRPLMRGYGVQGQGLVIPAPAAATNAAPKSTRQTFACRACNLSLDTDAALQAHIGSHIQYTKCSFTAAPKIVKAHIAGVHGKFSGSGFKSVTIAVPGCRVQRFSICVGNRPEDIQRWIAERRKRFPRSKQKVEKSEKKPEGLSTLLAGYSSSSSDDDVDTNKESTPKNVKADVAQSSRTKPNHLREESTLAVENGRHSYAKKPCRFFKRNGKCRNGDSCPFSHDKAPLQQAPKQQQVPGPKRRKLNLLDKLLTNDRKRESALTLQLLHYIAENDCFQTIGT